MKLLTKLLEKAFEKTGSTAEQETKDIKIICKWFNPTGPGTWYAYERDEDDPDIFICYADLGDRQMAESGSVSLKELESIKSPFNLGIERDMYFPINEYTLKQIIESKILP